MSLVCWIGTYSSDRIYHQGLKSIIPVGTICWPYVDPMLGQRRRRWTNKGPTYCVQMLGRREAWIKLRLWKSNFFTHLKCWTQCYTLLINTRDEEFKESFSFKTRMPGTVKCRPTVAYWVQIDGINIATELITRYYSNETLIQCCFNVRPTSATLAQHWANIR